MPDDTLPPTEVTEYLPIQSWLRSDIRKAAATLSETEARYLVDLYYQIQDFRKATGNQITAMTKQKEPIGMIRWTFGSMELIEKQIKKTLDDYTDTQHMGAWAKEIVGIGPVISAGLLAHIDMDKVHTVGSIWRFAGYDPTQTWEKKQKRPWNAALKTLCWKIGESFVKLINNDKCLYGKLYLQRKAMETEKNERLEYKDQASVRLEKYNIGKKTEAYKWLSQGILPPGQIHARAKRWAVKVFLCHWFEEAYRHKYGKEPPEIYSIAMLGHVHKIKPN